MKKTFNLRWLMTTLYSLFFSSGYVWAYDSYQSFRGRPMSLNVDFQYYKTQANFDANGNRQSLASGYSFQNINLNPKLRWQFGSDFALWGGFNYGSSESNDALFSRKNSIVNRVDLAAEYLFMNDVWMRLFGRLSYAHPLEKIDINGDAVLTSNGASEIYPEVILNLDFEDGIYTFLQGGVNVRGEGLSTLGTYGAGIEKRFASFGVGAAVLGALTIKEDEHTQNASYHDLLNNRVNAGSKIFNALNPNYHNLELNLNFLISQQSQFKVYMGSTLVGSNTSTGYYAGAHLNWIFDYTPASSKPNRSAPTRSKEEVLFKEKTDDGVNQDYFKPVTPVKPDYIQQLEGSKQNLNEATSPEPEPDPDEMIQTKKIPTKTKDYKIKLKKVKKN